MATVRKLSPAEVRLLLGRDVGATPAPREDPVALRKVIRQLCLLLAAATGRADPAAVAQALAVSPDELHAALRHAARTGAALLGDAETRRIS